jgi:hypothetical protein
MAVTMEKAKKAKAPPKTRSVSTKTPTKTAAKKQTITEKVKATTPTHEEIAHLARKYWAERGHHDGQAEQDWLRAERELRKMAS